MKSERELSHLLVYSADCCQWARGCAKARKHRLAPCLASGWQGSKYCLYQAMRKKLEWKWNLWDTKGCPYGCRQHRQQFHMLCHKADFRYFVYYWSYSLAVSELSNCTEFLSAVYSLLCFECYYILSGMFIFLRQSIWLCSQLYSF